MLVVSVGRGESRPYSYRGVFYRRVGNSTLAASIEDYKRMLFERMHNEQRWENQPATGWSVSDLDIAEIKLTVTEAVRRGRLEEPVGGDPTALLRGLGLVRDGVLLRAAVVLFGEVGKLESDMPQCLLRVARFKGLEKMEFFDNRQFNGNAFTLLANAERFMRDTLPIAGRFDSGRIDRIDEPLYPPLAIREALANALCHRDYSIGGGSVSVAIYDNCLEITSSGSLHFGLTPEKLFETHDSLPWNPLIARTFYRRGIIEEWGSGTLKMAKLMSKAGLPTPEIEDDGGVVIVRLRHGQFVAEKSKVLASPSERQEMILATLSKVEEGLTRKQIYQHLDCEISERQLQRALGELKKRGLVISVNRGPKTSWKQTMAR